MTGQPSKPLRIDYGSLMIRALRGMVRDLLDDVGRNGLPEPHGFYITFDTRHPGVQMNRALFADYPEQMTIVLEKWFENLEVDEDAFTVTLSFNNRAEPIQVPFEAVQSFVDQHAQFALRLAHADSDSGDREGASDESVATNASSPAEFPGRKAVAGKGRANLASGKAGEGTEEERDGTAASVVSIERYRK